MGRTSGDSRTRWTCSRLLSFASYLWKRLFGWATTPHLGQPTNVAFGAMWLRALPSGLAVFEERDGRRFRYPLDGVRRVSHRRSLSRAIDQIQNCGPSSAHFGVRFLQSPHIDGGEGQEQGAQRAKTPAQGHGNGGRTAPGRDRAGAHRGRGTGGDGAGGALRVRGVQRAAGEPSGGGRRS